MDPNTCLYELLSALASGDAPAALDHIADLEEWITRGGFLPTVDSGMEWGNNVEFRVNTCTA